MIHKTIKGKQLSAPSGSPRTLDYFEVITGALTIIRQPYFNKSQQKPLGLSKVFIYLSSSTRAPYI